MRRSCLLAMLWILNVLIRISMRGLHIRIQEGTNELPKRRKSFFYSFKSWTVSLEGEKLFLELENLLGGLRNYSAFFSP